LKVWCNGQVLTKVDSTQGVVFDVPRGALTLDDANLLVVRVDRDDPSHGLTASPRLETGSSPVLELSGRWQFRTGDDPSWSNMPLPAKFGGSTDIYFETPAPETISP